MGEIFFLFLLGLLSGTLVVPLSMAQNKIELTEKIALKGETMRRIEDGAPFNKPTENSEQAQLYQGETTKLYRARVLLENHQLWPQAYDLIQSVLLHTKELPEPVAKKLKAASRLVASYFPSDLMNQLQNKRKLVQPFLEAQYLINEALMDLRVELNNSVDFEVQVVEEFLKTYFFPGFEKFGKIHYPDLSSYGFDLYALTPENLNSARREASTAKSSSREVGNAKNFSSDNALPPNLSSPRLKQRLAIEEKIVDQTNSGQMSLDRAVEELSSQGGRQLSAEEIAAAEKGGFLQDLVDLGVAIDFISAQAKELWKGVDQGTRVMNRYLPQSLLLQAIAEPGLAILDPQLQDFLAGVRLELKLGEFEGDLRAELSFLEKALGKEFITSSSDGSFAFNVGEFSKMSRGAAESNFNLLARRPKGAALTSVYLITGVGGADLSRLQLLQASLLAIRDAETVKAGLGSLPKIPVLGSAMTITAEQYKNLVTKIPIWADHLLASAPQSGRFKSSLQYAAGYSLRLIGGIEKISEAAEKLRATKFGQQAYALTQSKVLKGGGLLASLVLLTTLSHATIGWIEQSHEDSVERRAEVQIETMAKMSASMVYILPYAGIAAAVVDTAHTTLGFPVETADLFRLWVWTVQASTLKLFYDTTKTMLFLEQLELEYVVPTEKFMYQRFLGNIGTLSDVENQLGRLYAYQQNTALRHLVLLYVAHKKHVDLQHGNYQFGKRVMHYFENFKQSRGYFEEVRDQLRTKRIESLISGAGH